MLKIAIDLPRDKIEQFCKKWEIVELSLFGSALRDDFHSDSDLDFLVTFDPSATWSLFDYVDMQDELQTILERNVDFVTRRGIERSQNNLRRDEILNSAKIIYALT